MTTICRAPYCQSLSREGTPFCIRHWRLLPVKHQQAVLGARIALRDAKDPIKRAFRCAPELDRAIDDAAALLGPTGPVPDHTAPFQGDGR